MEPRMIFRLLIMQCGQKLKSLQPSHLNPTTRQLIHCQELGRITIRTQIPAGERAC